MTNYGDTVVAPPSGTPVTGWETLPTVLNGIIPKLPTILQSSAQALAMEFYQLRTASNISSAVSPQVIPWFHNEAARNETRGRDMWQNTQPWMPLFIEYEAVYFHIPFSHWKLRQSPMLSNWGASVLQYGILHVCRVPTAHVILAMVLTKTSAKLVSLISVPYLVV